MSKTSPLRYLRTIRHLRPRQVFGRICRTRPRIVRDFSAVPRRQHGPWTSPISRAASQTGANRFRFLNEDRKITSWNDTNVPKLWLYNLHYFEHPTSELIERWVMQNPVGYGNGWEPYPLSIRTVNWIKWLLSGGIGSKNAIESLFLQLEYLSQTLEFHLSGNHLLANLFALTIGSHFFEGTFSDRWWRIANNSLRREIGEQILSDGGHYERSPMYHALVLESLLDLINVSEVYPIASVDDRTLWRRRASQMLGWLAAMTHSDGRLSFFNDATFGIAPEMEQLSCYAARLGVTEIANHTLGESGYIRLARANAVLLVDAGPVGPDHQPGHAHADTLSFELSINGLRTLVNSGTSTYERGPERESQRGTAAHNTVRIDGLDQSEVWSSFRVGHRARAAGVRTDHSTFVEAAHDGYCRLGNPVVHHRRFELNDNGLVIRDQIESSGKHTVEAFFHLHPEADLRIHLDQKFQSSVTPSYWYPGFNTAIPNRSLVGTWTGPCPAEFVSVIPF